MMELLAEFGLPGAYAVTWKFDGETHRITYGISWNVYTDDIKASREYGECVRHSLECAGKLTNY